MTSSTTTHQKAAAEDPVTPPATPPRLRRRPAVAAAALIAAILGALGIAWVWTSSSDTVQVLVVTHDVPRGALITASDLDTARITTDPLLHPVPASQADGVAGQRAATALVAGSLVTRGQLEDQAVPGTGQSIVAVALPAEQALGLALVAGDHVKVVVTPGDGQTAQGNPAFTEADVAAVATASDTGSTVVSLTVPEVDAPVLAARVASGNFYLVLDSREVG